MPAQQQPWCDEQPREEMGIQKPLGYFSDNNLCYTSSTDPQVEEFLSTMVLNSHWSICGCNFRCSTSHLGGWGGLLHSLWTQSSGLPVISPALLCYKWILYIKVHGSFAGSGGESPLNCTWYYINFEQTKHPWCFQKHWRLSQLLCLSPQKILASGPQSPGDCISWLELP